MIFIKNQKIRGKEMGSTGSEKEEKIKSVEKEILSTENKLRELKNQYKSLTGHVPLRKLSDHDWKWTIFMVLGFEFISCMVYLLGIRKAGRDLNTGIPSIFFSTDFAYFAILSFYILFMVLVIQPEKLGSIQTISLFLGFWCFHWLIYDWSWWAIQAGFGNIGDPSQFWVTPFGFDALIPDPPMWLFLTEALLGSIMGLYTFTVADSYKKVIPPAIWLFAIYGNAMIGAQIGLSRGMIIFTGIALVVIAFALAGFFTFQKIKRNDYPSWLKNFNTLKNKLKRENWSLDPLSPPCILIILIMLFLMHLFLVLIPVVGLFLGMIAWYFLPFFIILYHASNAPKYAKNKRLGIIIFLIAFIVILWLFFILIS